MQKLMHWDWPGNVRGLENLIQRSVILTTTPWWFHCPKKWVVLERQREICDCC